MKKSFASILLLSVIAIITSIALIQMLPPRALSINADSGLFSSGRAMKHVANIASESHMVNSPGQERVRKYIIKELENLGLTPVIQNTTSVSTGSFTRVANVANIITIVKGMANSKAILVMAHYDAVPLVAGVNDNGSSVAAILESLRALKSKPALKNDLIIFFTDGEEIGHLGAKAFVKESGLMNKIGFVINLDARGSSGPSLLSQTNNENGWVVREYNKSVNHKVTSSLLYGLTEIAYKKSTDFYDVQDNVNGGLSFAYCGSIEDYHSVTDDLKHISERSLQHHGENLLSALLHFGNIKLTSMRKPDVTFFSFIFPSMIIYPLSWNTSFSVLVTIMFLIFVFIGIRKKQINISGILRSFLFTLIKVISAGFIVFFLWKLIAPVHAEFGNYQMQFVYHAGLYFIGFILIGVAIAFIRPRGFSEKPGRFNHIAGAILLWIIMTWAMNFIFTEGSYIFIWPAFFTIAGMILIISERKIDLLSPRSIAIITITLTVSIYIYTQLIFLLYSVFVMILLPVIVGLIVLLVETLQIPLTIWTPRKSWVLPVMFVFLSVIFITIGSILPSRGKEYPKLNTLLYALDADSGKAFWLSEEEKLDDWTKLFHISEKERKPVPQFIPIPRYKNTPMTISNASVASLLYPTVEMLSDTHEDTIRTVNLKIQSNTNSLTESFIFIVPETTSGIYEVGINGHRIENDTTRSNKIWPIWYHGVFNKPFEVELKVSSKHPFQFQLVEFSDGLPITLNACTVVRPEWTKPTPFSLSDASIVRKSYSF